MDKANLSKTETHAEAPMTQLGFATASSPMIDHVWFISCCAIVSADASRYRPIRIEMGTHTEAPMTQIGHTAASKLYKTEAHTGAPM